MQVKHQMQNIPKLSNTYEHRQDKQEIQYHEYPPAGDTSSASSPGMMLKKLLAYS